MSIKFTQIPLGFILNYAGARKSTLQVPTLSLCSPPETDLIDIDPEWFMEVRGKRNVFGREQGYLYLSRKGLEHFKPQLKEAFENKINVHPCNLEWVEHLTWENWLEKAEQELQEIEKNTKKYADKMMTKARKIMKEAKALYPSS